MRTSKTAWDYYNLTVERDHSLKAMREEYDRRFDNLPVNEAGETNAEALLALNEWATRQEDCIEDIFRHKAHELLAKADGK